MSSRAQFRAKLQRNERKPSRRGVGILGASADDARFPRLTGREGRTHPWIFRMVFFFFFAGPFHCACLFFCRRTARKRAGATGRSGALPSIAASHWNITGPGPGSSGHSCAKKRPRRSGTHGRYPPGIVLGQRQLASCAKNEPTGPWGRQQRTAAKPALRATKRHPCLVRIPEPKKIKLHLPVASLPPYPRNNFFLPPIPRTILLF